MGCSAGPIAGFGGDSRGQLSVLGAERRCDRLPRSAGGHLACER